MPYVPVFRRPLVRNAHITPEIANYPQRGAKVSFRASGDVYLIAIDMHAMLVRWQVR